MVRRLVAAVLVVVSLVLLTVYLRESDDGALHGAQRLGQAALYPFQVAGERIARPFQDAYGWASDLVGAKDERDRLQAQVQALQQQVVELQTASQENERLRELLGYVSGPRLPNDYTPITSRVLAQPANPYDQTILVAAGSADGVTTDSPVVTGDGLVGRVTSVSTNASQVTLLTDQSIAVSALDLDTRAPGVLRRSPGSGSGLVLDRVEKDLVGLQDIDLYQRIQVAPFVNFDALSEVVILVSRG
jgi:rod shape-determining protein MreC